MLQKCAVAIPEFIFSAQNKITRELAPVNAPLGRGVNINDNILVHGNYQLSNIQILAALIMGLTILEILVGYNSLHAYLQANSDNHTINDISNLFQNQGNADSQKTETNFKAAMQAYRNQVAVA